jgi:hypothetical protein
MIVENIAGQTLDDNQAIWRYMDFASFYSMLLTKGLFFKRLDKFSDANEGTLWEESKHEQRQSLLKKDPLMTELEVENRIAKENANIESYKAWTLANSWSMGDHESFAMWKIYLSGSNEGVAVKTTIGKLKSSLEGNSVEILLGDVVYEPLKIGNINQHNVSTNKRKPYSFEREVRALAFNQFDIEKTVKTKVAKFQVGTTLNVAMDKLLEEVWISPFSDVWFKAIVRSAMDEFLPYSSTISIQSSRIKDR